MATSTPVTTGHPSPFKPQIPITPPPDCLNFASQSPQFSRREKDNTLPVEKDMPSAGIETQGAAQVQTQTTKGMAAAVAEAATPDCQCPENDNNKNNHTIPTAGATTVDPRYLTMVSRIAAYYQQRCQAVANYQHQKCQAWANMQRQKCQEMTQAALLVVAWYVRDRIQRRRKRQKRQFRRALSERSGVGKTKKAESVSKWASRIPDDLLSPDLPATDKPTDKDELDFTMDAEPTPDQDAKLYSVADNLIKSQLARIDVPLMGALSFTDDSESESESDYEELHRWRPDGNGAERGVAQGGGSPRQGQDDGLEDDDDDGGDDDDDDDYSYEDEDLEDYDEDDGSQRVHKGTGNGTRKGAASLHFQ